MEKRYGKHIIQQALEETFSNEWLEEFAKKCPECGANIQVNNYFIYSYWKIYIVSVK